MKHYLSFQVYTGADGCLVWILSKNGRVFARLGITESLPVGEHWTEVQYITYLS